jgi:hypothetical protein
VTHSDLYQPENLRRWSSADPATGTRTNYIGEDLSDFYVAPCSITRDTADALTLSNWETMLEELDALIEHEESGEHTFNHWACGWYSLFIIHETDTAALKTADDMAAALADYPVLDEEALSEKEHEEATEAWESWGRSDWRSTVEKALAEYAPDSADSYWADEILDTIEEAKLDTLWQQIADWLPWDTIAGSDGPTFNFRDAANSLDCATLAEFTGLPLLPPDQQWRREPYPWPGADPSPLVPSLPEL